MYEMPTVAVILAGATVGLLIVIGLTCKALGGWYFLAAQICGFTAMLQLVHGVGVAYAGFCEHRPSPLNQLGLWPGAGCLLSKEVWR